MIMKRRLFIGLLSILLTLVTLSSVTVRAANPTTTSFNFSINTKFGDSDPVPTDLGLKNYGDTVTFDAGTPGGYEFVTYIVNGKVEPTLPAIHTFIVTGDLAVTAFYKPTGTVMVAFMDSNQDMLSVQYISSGASATPPDISSLTKPGYAVSSAPWSGSYISVTEDTVLWVQYTSLIGDTFTVNVTNGSADKGSYSFNEVATVTASGTGNFQHWEKDGVIMSINPVYSFTVLENTTLIAVYDSEIASPNPDSLFVNMTFYLGIDMGQMTVVGQFVLPDGNSLVEYGLIASSYQGGITLDTPDVEKIRINKYFATTNEFVKNLEAMTYFMSRTVRAYMITTNGATETITYSDMPFYATDLFISEYIEGSSYNKAIEIYNGMGHDINLAEYSLALYANGSSSSSSTYDLTGTLAQGDVIVVAHTSSGAELSAVADVLDSVVNFNGDDAIALLKSGTPIDVFGIIGEDPVTKWDIGGVTNASENHTIVRKSNVISPTTIWNTSDWDVNDQDDFNFIGSHTMQVVEPTTLTITGTATVMSGLTTDLDITYYPTTATQNVIWVSSNTGVATVNQYGVVTGVSEGTATISAYSYINNSVYDTQTVTVTAPVTYSITYIENGGSAVSDETNITANTAVTAPTPPTLTDFVFDGWYIDDGVWAQEFSFATLINQDYTLYAKWLDEFTVTFSPMNGDSVSTVKVADGSKITALDPEPTKTDYVFDGWYTSSDGGTTLDTSWNFSVDTVTANITLYAKWAGAGTEVLAYSTTFESAEQFTASTVYNNTTLKYSGPVGSQWVSYYGTPSTTSPIEGSQSMQCRWYSTAPSNLGYIKTDFTVINVTKVVFYAASTSTVDVQLTYSTDGGSTWIGAETFDLGSSSAEYTYTINATGSVLIKFQIIYSVTPASGARLYVDNVKIYHNPE